MNKKTLAYDYTRNISEHSASVFLALLLSADLAFIALHSIRALTPFLNSTLFNIEGEGSYSEFYQYIKWLWIIIVLVYISVSRRSFSYIAWVLVFTYLLCDDALSIHETLGLRIAGTLTLAPPFGLRPRDLGELVVSGAAGLALLLSLIWAYRHGPQAFKKVSQDILLLIFVLVFFGVVVDMANSSLHLKLGSTVSFLLGVIEDGGEMLIASLILWYVFLLSVRDTNATSYLSDFVRVALTRRFT